MQLKISKRASKQLEKPRLKRQFKKQGEILLTDSSHNSLDFKPLKGGIKGFYSFRINDKYRARLVKLDEETFLVLVVGNFH